jgi:hypothetical protein
VIEPVLLTATPVFTFDGLQRLTNASGFFFERDGRLFLVTSRHVMIDEASNHFPDRVEIELHIEPENMARSIGFSIPLYRDGKSAWRQAHDSGGPVDVAAIEIERDALPSTAVYRPFTPGHLPAELESIPVGKSLLIVGFPLGFHDTLHHLPVVRHAALASSFGLRFQGQGCFLTDARTHRGTSGAPVVIYRPEADRMHDDLACTLLGVHSAVFDVGSRDLNLDEALGLNCAWYADILLTLTDT